MPSKRVRSLGDTFRETILAWSHCGDLVPVLANPACPPPPGIKVWPLPNPAPSAKPKSRNPASAIEWPELGVHSYVYPCFLFVIEGEADIRIGILPEGAASKNTRRKKVAPPPEVRLYELPARSCLIVPVGVPYSDGKTPHWERENPDDARSQILWLQILPVGAIVHICRSAGRAHTHSSALFIQDPQLWLLTQFLLDRTWNAQTGAARQEALLRSYLATLLLSVDQSWGAGQVIDSDEVRRVAVTSEQPGQILSETGDAHGAALERACHYIQSHLIDSLTPEQIARHAFVSLPQLKRLFRARLNTSVMKYVTQRRIEEAKALLLSTGLNIDHIAATCGYPHRTHFSRVFKAHCGLSPQSFRRQYLTVPPSSAKVPKM